MKSAVEYLTQDEVRQAFDTLSSTRWSKLGRAAQHLAYGLGVSGEDFLHTAIMKTLEGKRRCPRDIPIEVFVYNTVRSLIASAIKQRGRDPLQSRIFIQNNNDEDELASAISEITPEDELQAEQALNRLFHHLENDPRLKSLIDHQMNGLTPTEIKKVMDLTPVEYASALKALTRLHQKLIS